MQRKLAQHVRGDVTIICSHPQSLTWQTLQLKRTKRQLMLLFKIINNLIKSPSFPP